MKKYLEKHITIIILLLMTFAISIPLMDLGALNAHDSIFHLFRNYSTSVALEDGQLIPMVNHYMIGGFGYAPNIFYGVLSTYFISFINIFTPTLGLASNIFIMITIFLSGLFMYNLVNEIFNNKFTSLIAALFYMIAPYHLLNIFLRGAQGEIIAFLFIPLLFHGIYNILNRDSKKWYYLTIGASGLLLSHNISSLLAALFAFLYLIFNYKKLNKKNIMTIFKAIIFALFISAITIIPLLEAKFSGNYMVFNNNYMNSTTTKMATHSVNIFNWNKGSLANILNIIVIISIILSILTLIKTKFNKNVKSFNILNIISIILVLNIIPWNLLPDIFGIIQFSWRMLLFTTFFLSIGFAYYLVTVLKHDSTKKLVIIFLITVALGFSVVIKTCYHDTINDSLLNSNKLKKRDDIVRSTGSASAEYLPQNAIYNYEYLKDRGNNPIDLYNRSTISNIVKNGTNLSFNILVNKGTDIELPYIYYPGYIVKLDDKKIDNFENDNGMVSINVNPGQYNIKVKYRGSNLMIIAYFISFVSSIGLVIVIILEKKKNY